MRFWIIGSLLIFSSLSFAQVPVVKFNALEQLLKNQNDTTYVLNFWATWCKPCITELPHFEALNRQYGSGKVKVVLVSLDFKRQLESQLVPYVARNNIRSTVLLLDEPDYNSWINRVDSSWSGAIPATVIWNKGKRKFFEKEFASYGELENEIKPFIQ